MTAHSYGARLFDQHAQLLADSAISVEVAAEREYVSVDTRARRAGFKDYQRRAPGLLIPVHDVTGSIATYQYRPDVPRTANGSSKPVK